MVRGVQAGPFSIRIRIKSLFGYIVLVVSMLEYSYIAGLQGVSRLRGAGGVRRANSSLKKFLLCIMGGIHAKVQQYRNGISLDLNLFLALSHGWFLC